MNGFEITHLVWDSDFFGFSVGKVRQTSRTVDADELLQFMRLNRLTLLYWHTPYRLPLEFEKHFILTQVTLEKPLNSSHISPSTLITEQPESYGRKAADPQLRQLAYQAGWSSRFQVDRKIEKSQFRKLYDIWLERSCLREIADEVLVTTSGEAISGFVTLKVKEEVTKIDLIAVDEKYRGKGVGGVLMNYSEAYALAHGSKALKVVTQSRNEAALRLYAKHGMEIVDTQHWYHIWRNSLEP
jgi:dTDP-4-amino-4,6-dideoxy-D-galactose acyltransferase